MPLTGNLILIAVTCLISWIGFKDRSFLERWLLNPYQARRKKRLAPYLSYGFVHADFMHLLFNMITLFFFGQVKTIGMTERASAVAFNFVMAFVWQVFEGPWRPWRSF